MIEPLGVCSECGALVINPERHAEWHRLADPMHWREQSEPLFEEHDRVCVRNGGLVGEVVNYWEERGPLHCYTVRFGPDHMQDFLQDELAPVQADAAPAPLTSLHRLRSRAT